MIRRAVICAAWALLGCDPNVLIGSLPDAAKPPEISWNSGAHAGNELKDFTDFANYRGRPIAVATVFPDRARDWDGVVMPWPLDAMRGFAGTLVLSLPLYPEGQGYDNRACAAGEYDSEWRKLGTNLSARGRANSILRLGWGWNDLEHEWRADADLANWITCFRRVVSAVRSTLPGVRITWDFNPPGPPHVMTGDPYAAYPGDDYVDYVGFEVFDEYPPAPDAAAWDARCNTPAGLCRLMAFAREHGKRVGISEWGVVTCGASSGGDNPYFIQRTVETFDENSDIMQYEAYFESGATEPCSDLGTGSPAPHAAERYRQLYREP
ncbi:MAG TPA: hypothetical protein VJV78_40090 [Polyangiales bacterium]|nr:hypothetical protein [Polyangiales bacterium]